MRRLGIDIDGVLADFNTAFAKLLGEKTGARVPPGFSPTTWNYPEEELGLTGKEVSRVWYWIMAHPEWWDTLAPFPEAIIPLQEAENDNLLFFITNRNEKYAKVTAKWLQREFSLPNAVVIHTPEKPAVVKALRLDMMVEDSLENATAIARLTGTTSFLLDRPYNQTHGKLYKVSRVGSLQEALGEAVGI